jgi:signal peptidase
MGDSKDKDYVALDESEDISLNDIEEVEKEWMEEPEQKEEMKEKKVKRKISKKKDKKIKKKKVKYQKRKLKEEEVKYSTVMWIAFLLLFFGIFFIVINFWISNSMFTILAAVFLIAGVPLFIFEYLKLDAKGKRSVKRSALYLLRDVAIALLIVGIIMASILVYSQTSPPMVVIESDSMQHSDTESYIGTIDTGDLVLVRNAPAKSDVTTYVEGRGTGYKTYSDYGDVIVFRKFGAAPSITPIIHRAMFYVIFNETTNSSYDIPALKHLELNVDWGGINADNTTVTYPYNLTGTIWLSHVGYADKRFSFDVTTFDQTRVVYDATEFYLTAGDHNIGGRNFVQPDPWIVKQEWIIGVARGEIPWFGLIKLTLNPDESGCCDGWGDPYAPKNSWNSLLITIIVIIVLPFVFDFTLGYIASRREKKDEEESEEEMKEKDKIKEMLKKKRKAELKEKKKS